MVQQLRAGPALANLAAAEKMLMMLCWLLLLLSCGGEAVIHAAFCSYFCQARGEVPEYEG